MSGLADALNGGKVVIFAETITEGVYLLIGGQTAHSKNLTLEPIEISNKSLPGTREYLEGEGRKLADITSEILWSDDAAYQFLRQKYDDKEFVKIQIRYLDDLSRVDFYTVLITAISEPAEQNTAVISSITFSNTDEFTIEVALANFKTTSGDFFKTTNGNQFLVRV